MTKRIGLLTSGGLNVAIAMPHCVAPAGALVRTARRLAICLGDE